MEKQTCVLCGIETGAYRNAYRSLRGNRITNDGFVPRNRFTYEEIKKMEEGGFSVVCADRRKCLDEQLITR